MGSHSVKDCPSLFPLTRNWLAIMSVHQQPLVFWADLDVFLFSSFGYSSNLQSLVSHRSIHFTQGWQVKFLAQLDPPHKRSETSPKIPVVEKGDRHIVLLFPQPCGKQESLLDTNISEVLILSTWVSPSPFPKLCNIFYNWNDCYVFVKYWITILVVVMTFFQTIQLGWKMAKLATTSLTVMFTSKSKHGIKSNWLLLAVPFLSMTRCKNNYQDKWSRCHAAPWLHNTVVMVSWLGNISDCESTSPASVQMKVTTGALER